MALTKRLGKQLFGPVGISLVGSLTHVVTQFLLVLWLYVQNSAVFFLLPLLLASGFVGGIVVGWITSRLLPVVQSTRLHD
jgi:heptaprenyl diphosphate synthase